MSLTINQLSQTLLRRSKTVAFTAALLLTVGISSSFATITTKDSSATPKGSTRTASKDGGHNAVTASFHKDFQKAEVLQTEAKKNFTKFTFRMNNMVMTAYYTYNGQLLAITRNFTSDQLPISLLMQVKRNYADYWISDLFEINTDDTSNYYITLENSDTRVTLRSVGEDWEVYSKTAKK